MNRSSFESELVGHILETPDTYGRKCKCIQNKRIIVTYYDTVVPVKCAAACSFHYFIT